MNGWLLVFVCAVSVAIWVVLAVVLYLSGSDETEFEEYL